MKLAASHLFPLIYRSRGSPTGARFAFSNVDVERSSAAPLHVVSGAEQKTHLIEAAPFGCLDQMLRTTVWGVCVWGGKASPAKNWGVWGAAPPSQNWKKRKTRNLLNTQSVSKPH